MDSKSSYPYYPRSPVVERVVSVYADVSEENFERKIDDWALQVSPDFPEYEPLKEWNIPFREVKTETGEVIPVLDEQTEPTLKITQRFSKKTSKDGFDWSIRCPAGQFTMNMHSNPGSDAQKRRFEHLRKETEIWLPRWFQQFDVNQVRRISIYYVNILNYKTVPSFYNESGFRIGDVITIFSNIPGEFESIVPPYDATVTVKLKGHENAFLRMNVGDWPKSAEPAVQVDFQADILCPDGGITTGETFPLLDWLHMNIVKQFDKVFTAEAKKSFGDTPA